jgi:imidazoleglycerol-phosphate dehydratase / histidinol-phosphatase
MIKAAFLDRDGALIREPEAGEYPGETDYQVDRIEKLKILPGVIEGLQMLIRNKFILLMITNQDKLGSPVFPRKNFESPHQRMLEIFRQNRIMFEQVFICPHDPDDNCDCRKPKTAMVESFLIEREIDRKESFMYGDRDSDRKFAENLGIHFFPVKTNSPFAITQGDLDALLKKEWD